MVGIKNLGVYEKSVTITIEDGSGYLDTKYVSGKFEVESEGIHNLDVTFDDKRTEEYSFTIVSELPEILGVQDGKAYNQDVFIFFDRANGFLNNVSYVSGTPIKKEGKYVLEIKTITGVSIFTNFEIDKTTPVISGVENGKTYYELAIIGHNEGEATLNGVKIQNGEIISSEGEYKLVVKDKAGNTREVEFAVKELTLEVLLKLIKSNPQNTTYYKKALELFQKENKLDSIKVFVNGELVDFSKFGNVAPRVISGKPFIPVMAVAEHLGFEVHFNPEISNILGKMEDLEVIFALNSNLTKANGKDAFMKIPRTSTNDRALIATRFISELFRREIFYESANNDLGVFAIYTTGNSKEVQPGFLDFETIGEYLIKVKPTISGVKNNDSYNKDVNISISYGNIFLDGSSKEVDENEGVLDRRTFT